MTYNTIKTKSGFTLIEMLVTIGIMLLLMAIAIPFDMAYRKKAEIKKSAKELRSLFWEAQTRSLAPRTKDIVSYKIDLVKNAATSGATIFLQECIATCNPITGAQTPRVVLGSNITIEDIKLGNNSEDFVQISFAVGDNRNSGQISFIPPEDPLADKMTVTVGSLIDSSLKYDIVVDRQMGSITYNARNRG